MTATPKDLYIEQGATWRFGFNWHHEGPPDANGQPTAGDPYDLTGWTIRMQVRKSQQSPVIVDASTTNGKITTIPLEGRIDVKLTDEDTDMLTTRSALYDLEAEDSSGDVYRLLQGRVTVDPNITQTGTEPVVEP